MLESLRWVFRLWEHFEFYSWSANLSGGSHEKAAVQFSSRRKRRDSHRIRSDRSRHFGGNHHRRQRGRLETEHLAGNSFNGAEIAIALIAWNERIAKLPDIVGE